MTTPTVDELIVQETEEQIYERALAIATSLDLPVTTWQPGDPTRSLYYLEAATLAALEACVAGFIRSGFIGYAQGAWLKLRALQDFGVTVPDATYATATVRLTNGGGGFYTVAPGDLTLKSSVNDKTYRNTTGGTLASGPGTYIDIDVVADEPGSDSSAGIGEIDTMITTLLGVTCANTTTATGIDEQPEETTRAQCYNKLGSLSPDGPAEAYDYVALNSELTGTSNITRVRSYPNSANGQVKVYVAGPSGAVSSGDLALVTAAILKWATPLCITPIVASAANVTVDVTYEIWIYSRIGITTAQAQADIQSALEQAFANLPIGGDILPPATTGNLYLSTIEKAILNVYDEAIRVVVSAPAADVAIANGEVPALGTVTGTINLVAGP